MITVLVFMNMSNRNKHNFYELLIYRNSKLEEEKKSSKVIKPPNVLVCADTSGATDNLQNLLLTVLEEDRHVLSFILY